MRRTRAALPHAYVCHSHARRDGGASWEFVDVVYGGGAGYSDIHVLPGGWLGVAFQKTFDPPDPHIEGGGYNLGFARLKVR